MYYKITIYSKICRETITHKTSLENEFYKQLELLQNRGYILGKDIKIGFETI